MRKITEIIIHCADTPNGKEFHNTDIDRWHKERGWIGIGYHWVIPISGIVESGRLPNVVGAHAAGHNSNSLGICLIGKDKFTQAQWDSLAYLVDGLKQEFPEAKVIGHYQVDKHGKTCPNFSVPKWIENNYTPEAAHILS